MSKKRESTEKRFERLIYKKREKVEVGEEGKRG
jgi:hypothetical protein